MYADDIKAYSELIVAMVHIEPGAKLEIRGEPVHWGLINEIAAAAYRRGARFVRAQSVHPGLHRARIEHAAEDYLDDVPTQVRALDDIILEEGWSLVAIKSPEDPDFFADVDVERNARIGKAMQQAAMPLRRALQADRFPWLVVAASTEGWARKVLGSTRAGDRDPESRERLWETMRPILRLDHEDPVAAWREQSQRLKRRAAALDELEIEWLHFEAPGTDLWVGVPRRAIWVGGPAKTPGGLEFLPNMPTEEVFTTPDYRKTTGRVAVTRPVTVMNKVVEGAWFEFEDGRVVRYGGRSNEEVLGRYLDMDAGAAYAGEIALVDAASPIFESGHTFYNILFDENAACHIALGGAYPGCIEGGDELSDEELPSIGANVSFVHTDFMIGSEQVQVTARTYDGRDVAILRDGRFTV
jgi:aminopeptidase